MEKKDKIKEQKRRELQKFENGLLTGIAITASAIVIGLFFIYWGDTGDMIHTEGMGKKICEEYGLEYSQRELNIEDGYGKIPTIYCKENEPLLDGIVKKVGGE
jgi:hypothetical protein